MKNKKSQEAVKNVAVLVVDDDAYLMRTLIDELADAGFDVVGVRTVNEAVEAADSRSFAVAVVDVMMPAGPELALETWGGFRTGQVLARRLRDKFPEMKIIGWSSSRDQRIREWFTMQRSMAFVEKSASINSALVDMVTEMAFGEKRPPRIFIVHGRDMHAVLELKNFIQNQLKLGEPIILAEQPSQGRTIIEKFEDYASLIDIAFILLTPEDTVHGTDSNVSTKRARQNVIFELGYFAGFLGRKSGKLIALVKDKVELPSDVCGIVYIDITHGINAAGESIRREVSSWF